MAKKSYLTMDSNGDIYDAAPLRGVKQMDNGVVLVGENGRFIHHIKESNSVRAEAIRDEVAKQVMALKDGKDFTPVWPSRTADTSAGSSKKQPASN